MITLEVTSFKVKENTHKTINQDGRDITPKPLVHHNYSILYDKNMMYLDSIISRQKINTTNHIKFSSKNDRSILSLINSTSLSTGILDTDDIENSIFWSNPNSRVDSTDQFLLCLHRPESCSHKIENESSKCSYLTKKKIILTESETTFIFKLLQLTEDCNTSDDAVVKEAKKQSQNPETKLEFIRPVIDTATQTFEILTKSRFSHLASLKMINRKNLTNNWIMHDAYNTTKLERKTNGLLYENISKGIPHSEKLQNRLKFLKVSNNLKIEEDQITRLYKNSSFAVAVRVMEQIICIKLHLRDQKYFKGFITSNPYVSKVTYSLKYLWSYMHISTVGTSINCIRWNPTNSNLLAVSYGRQFYKLSGYLLIWNMKHPTQPERFYKLDFAVSEINWSHKTPNQLAIGCYNGSLRIIDISKRNLITLYIIPQKCSFTFSRIWQVQWWLDNGDEYIYASSGNGKIFRCQVNDDAAVTEVMRISRIDDCKLDIKQKNNYTSRLLSTPVRNEPEAILLQRHPIFNNIYLVGSDEGYIYRCSTVYSNCCINSFLAHDGPICSLEYSPFHPRIFLTTGADWCIRIWADDIMTPLITLSTQMSHVIAAAWSPKNSTIIATCVKNEICIWDLKQSIQKPKSITALKNFQKLISLSFTPDGNQIVIADNRGFIHVYNCEGIPFKPLNQTEMLVESIKKKLMTKQNLLQQFQKLDKLF
ncbi:WD repeat-containing protein 78-like [Chelonus insularis]|uniref:WD repeat-containing protein 78-like n=1 Tax=Chelonus insularis TaxID=460826 RepID=UPI001589F62C|nr:WD repeat-containing protein 78-like [Chelonus insularis]